MTRVTRSLITLLFIATIHKSYIESAVLQSQVDQNALISDGNILNPLNLNNPVGLLERIKRNLDQNITSASESLCGAAPCGYCPYQRSDDLRFHTLYFVRNTCKCPQSQKCVLHRNKYSGYYYLYHCSEHASVERDPCPYRKIE